MSIINIKKADNVLLPEAPESEREKSNGHLSGHYNSNPLKPLSADEIYSELAEARASYARGEFEDFDDAIDKISEKYGL